MSKIEELRARLKKLDADAEKTDKKIEAPHPIPPETRRPLVKAERHEFGEKPKPEPYHVHVDKQGIAHRCYHACRHRWYIWLPIVFVFQVLAFPYEHKAAEMVWELPGLEWFANHTGVGNDHE